MSKSFRRFVSLAGWAVLLWALLGSLSLAQTSGGVLTIGLGYEIDTLNPYSTGRLGDVQATVLEGLVAPDENAEWVPVLATEVPTLPIISSPSIIAVPANLRNFVPNPTNMTNFVHSANWYLE